MVFRREIRWIVLSWCGLLVVSSAAAQSGAQPRAGRATLGLDPYAQKELTRLRADALAKLKDSRAKNDQLLKLYEAEQERLRKELEKRRNLYREGLISLPELLPLERDLATSIHNISEVKRWITEDDIALAEVSLRDELLRLPALARGGFSEGGALIRFNGAARWSLADAARIQNFFSQVFGKTLPLSAFGQSMVHDRLRLDHHDAMDVALHPDSEEGRSLIGYLRQGGIPFIAFRGSVPGASTGAHIHIGKPSTRQ